MTKTIFVRTMLATIMTTRPTLFEKCLCQYQKPLLIKVIVLSLCENLLFHYDLAAELLPALTLGRSL